MKNLVYDLPLDCQEIILKEKQLLDAKMNVINQLKGFDILLWSETRWLKGKFPYREPYSHATEFYYFKKRGYYQNGRTKHYMTEHWVTPALHRSNYNDTFWWLSRMIEELKQL